MKRRVAYQGFVPTEGGTVTPTDWCELANLVPAGALTAVTLNAPLNPRDGQPFGTNSTTTITTLTLTAQSGSGQTIQGAAVTLTAGGVGPRWVFNGPQNAWMVA